jgi:Yip1-like protein
VSDQRPLPPLAPPAASSPASPSAPAGATSPEAAGPGFLDTLIGIYTEPGETFRRLVARPTFVAALVASMLLNVGFTFVWLHKMDAVKFMRAQIDQSPMADRIPPEKHEEIVHQRAAMMPMFAWLGPVVFVPLGAVALSGLFLFVYRFFYAAETTFRQSLTVVCWTFFAVGLVSTALTLLILSLRGEWSVDPSTVIKASPAALFDRRSLGHPLYALLGSFDLFSAWYVFLLSVGFAATARKSVGSAAFGVIALWAVYVALKVGFSFIF